MIQFVATEPPTGAEERAKPTAILGHYMQTPPEATINDLQRNSDKRWDLGWVYTVIAGVLNVLVIYDAFAGPVVRDESSSPGPKSKPAPPEGRS